MHAYCSFPRRRELTQQPSAFPAFAVERDEISGLNPSWRLKLLFDGECPFCKREIAWMQKRNKNGYLAFEDISSPNFDPHIYRLTQEEVMGVIHGVLDDGSIIKKLDVFIEAYRLIGLGWLVAPLSWPIIRSIAALGYEIFARYRIPLGNFFGARSCNIHNCGFSNTSSK